VTACKSCGGRAELAVTPESGGAVVWLCNKCARRLAAKVAPTFAAQLAAGDPALRIRTGVQTEPGDVLAGTSTRHRPVVRVTGLGRDDEYVGEWGNDEAAAFERANELAASVRERVSKRAREVGNN
jgi:hypothetical protein